jgi:hypothetical protein
MSRVQVRQGFVVLGIGSGAVVLCLLPFTVVSLLAGLLFIGLVAPGSCLYWVQHRSKRTIRCFSEEEVTRYLRQYHGRYTLKVSKVIRVRRVL